MPASKYLWLMHQYITYSITRFTEPNDYFALHVNLTSLNYFMTNDQPLAFDIYFTSNPSLTIHFHWFVFQTVFDALIRHDRSELIRRRSNLFNYISYKQVPADKTFAGAESVVYRVLVLSINATDVRHSSRNILRHART